MNFKEFFSTTTYPVQNMSLFSLTHILWIIVPILLIIPSCLLFKKYPKIGKIVLILLCAYMLVIRVLKNIILKRILWKEDWVEILPFQLCAFMILVIPFTVFFKTKKLNKYLYPLAIMGGFVTMVYPDWVFNGYSMNFNKLESLIAHSILIYVPITSIAIGYFKLNFKEIYKPTIALLILVLYAHIGNIIFPNHNFMFLQSNPLPFQIPGIHHLFTFALLYICFILILYSFDIIKHIVKLFKRNKKRN